MAGAPLHRTIVRHRENGEEHECRMVVGVPMILRGKGFWRLTTLMWQRGLLVSMESFDLEDRAQAEVLADENMKRIVLEFLFENECVEGKPN